MTAITVAVFSKNAEQYVEHAVRHQDVVRVTTDAGNAILVSEEEYRGMLETMRLMNAEGMPERVAEARRTPIEESDAFEW